MKLSIRMKIFLPVMAIMTLFPLAVWAIFSYMLEMNMNYNARRDLGWAIDRMETKISDSESFLEEMSEEMDAENVETRMMAVGEGYRLLYPVDFSNQPEMTELYPMFLTKATGAEEFWEAGEIIEETIDHDKYLLYYLNLGSGEEDEVHHLILYHPVHDASGIKDQISRFLLLIAVAMAGVAILVFWFVAGSISGPLIRLCEAARGIGEKKFQKVETGATVKEICQLEDELNQMQEKLSQADQAERTFFQNASHELRTPLMSISGYAQGIQCGVFEDTSQAAGVILDESTRLTEVVDGILTLTRMDQLRYQVVPVDLNIESFVEERLELLEGFAYSQKKKLVYENGSSHKLITDAMLLERAFSNVVSNCIRYAKETVTVKIEGNESHVLLTIMDDGPGIREDEKEKIFDRFHKGQNGNHGLGLAIAKRSLEYMGGTIKAVPSASGAVFEMTLPYDCRSFAPEEWKEM
ncbi:MAG: HAMP domain-containing histidine kinase [Lachnospiraceae bacterium]|nr:HAMP domain-containing histidine kinase [Lachnospiraceae bacterium]